MSAQILPAKRSRSPRSRWCNYHLRLTKGRQRAVKRGEFMEIKLESRRSNMVTVRRENEERKHNAVLMMSLAIWLWRKSHQSKLSNKLAIIIVIFMPSSPLSIEDFYVFQFSSQLRAISWVSDAIKSNDIILSLFLCFRRGVERQQQQWKRQSLLRDPIWLAFPSPMRSTESEWISILVVFCSSNDEWFLETRVNDTERCGWESAENRDVFSVNVSS